MLNVTLHSLKSLFSSLEGKYIPCQITPVRSTSEVRLLNVVGNDPGKASHKYCNYSQALLKIYTFICSSYN